MNNHKELERLFYYKDGNLYNRIQRGSAGKDVIAGNLANNGYFCIKVNGKSYKAHRLIYKFHNPEWNLFDSGKSNQIDHLNRIRGDNRIENLRVVTAQENSHNNGAKGYYWNKATELWQASIRVNGKASHLGFFKKEGDARKAYLEKKAKVIEAINEYK
jgi:hypothetical protein